MAIIISVEGTDGSGKQTQCELIKDNLTNAGYSVCTLSFPMYDNENSSSFFVKEYLNGKYGDISSNKTNEYSASMIFAMDRLISYMTDWSEYYKKYDFIIMDRYVESNLIHQGARIQEIPDLVRYIDWETDFEYNRLGLPKPDMTLFLNMTPEASSLLRENRLNKITKEKKKDIHEADKVYQLRSYRTAYAICDMCGWKKIDCVNTECVESLDDIKSVEEINKLCMDEIYSNTKVKRLIKRREN